MLTVTVLFSETFLLSPSSSKSFPASLGRLALQVGSRRFNKLRAAVGDGLVAPPVDLRYLTRPGSESDSEVRSSVASFLSEIYRSVAETLPDFRDDTADDDVPAMIEVDREEEHDPYGEFLESPDAVTVMKVNAVTGEPKRKKPRKMRGSIKLNPSRAAQVDSVEGEAGCEPRWLPPGQIKDYWEQYRQRHKATTFKCASFTLFYRVALFAYGVEFYVGKQCSCVVFVC